VRFTIGERGVEDAADDEEEKTMAVETSQSGW
jgi:hypothetical protein